LATLKSIIPVEIVIYPKLNKP